MNCFDCTAADPVGPPHEAVATCVHCGAGVCVDHAIVMAHHLTRTELINREVPVEPAARRICCPTCAAAVVTAATPPDHHAHRPHNHH